MRSALLVMVVGRGASIPTAAIAAGMVGVGSVLAIAARRRSNARRSLS